MKGVKFIHSLRVQKDHAPTVNSSRVCAPTTQTAKEEEKENYKEL